jgi:hypothetical protein
MALVRLDRLEGALTADGQPATAEIPPPGSRPRNPLRLASGDPPSPKRGGSKEKGKIDAPPLGELSAKLTEGAAQRAEPPTPPRKNPRSAASVSAGFSSARKCPAPLIACPRRSSHQGRQTSSTSYQRPTAPLVAPQHLGRRGDPPHPHGRPHRRRCRRWPRRGSPRTWRGPWRDRPGPARSPHRPPHRNRSPPGRCGTQSAPGLRR